MAVLQIYLPMLINELKITCDLRVKEIKEVKEMTYEIVVREYDGVKYAVDLFLSEEFPFDYEQFIFDFYESYRIDEIRQDKNNNCSLFRFLVWENIQDETRKNRIKEKNWIWDLNNVKPEMFLKIAQKQKNN